MTFTKKEFDDRIEYHNEFGELHRTDGPAIEYKSGTKQWYINGKLHRTDGPAIEYSNGDKSWYINGECHREDGPARIWVDTDEWFHLNNYRYTEEDWKQEVAKIKLKRILEL
jgi:hypothetical protein